MTARPPATTDPAMSRLEITRLTVVRQLLKSRWLQWTLIAITLPFFALAVLAGLFGTPVGSRNFGIVFVWIVWWGLAIMVLVPIAGRLWCAMCPIPAPGEWLQRRSLVEARPGGKLVTLGWRWPRRLRSIWLQNALFLVVSMLYAVILTTPLVTGLVLLGFVLAAVATSLLFERRVFCRYLCPLGGFIGLYSQMAPVEVRIKDHAVCVAHKDKTCYRGSDDGYGCPWLLFPATLDRNTNCGLCAECLKTCPLDNIGLYARPFGADLLTTHGRRLDEAFRALVVLTCALVWITILNGPWAVLKETAFAIGTPAWFVFAGTFLGLNLLVVPGLFLFGAGLSRLVARSAIPIRKLFVSFGYTVMPVGLAAWVSFGLSLVFVNSSLAWPVLSDPFGWGWDLFGTANWGWTPYAAGLIPQLQVPILLTGLVAAIAVALRTARQLRVSQLAALPSAAFSVAVTLVLLWLFVG